MLSVSECFHGSNASATMRLFDELLRLDENGQLACLLFKALKASVRAKVYRGWADDGRSFRSLSYDRKGEALSSLAEFLDCVGSGADVWGWKIDPHANHSNHWVLYLELPDGQVSFHSPKRFAGPDFLGEWDGVLGASEERVIRFCESVLRGG